MMAEAPLPATTIVTQLDEDALAHCTSYLTIRDISSMAMACKFFKRVAYSDSVWHRLFSEKWPNRVMSGSSKSSTVREAYLARHTAVNQFKFVDPLMAEFHADAKPFSHVLLHRNNIFLSEGSTVQTLKIDCLLSGKDSLVTLGDHNARITCVRLYPLNEAYGSYSDTEKSTRSLVTSSSDHSIRLWGKNSCQRAFKGHRCPVTTLSNKLLGDGISKVFASGGEDGTVRLWSLFSSGKHQKNLKATLYGHERPLKLISVAGHKPSLLVTVAKDSKIRVWDSNASAARSSCCVGTASVPGSPMSIKCYESLLYIAAGASVLAIDLRTMKKAFTAADCQHDLRSFGLLPSKSLVCTGMDDRALLWDIRKSQEQPLRPKPISELDGHDGPVSHVHMDSYKIVTGGTGNFNTHIWDTATGARLNSLICCYPDSSYTSCGCSCMAVDGSRIVTTSSCEAQLLRFRDFSDASCAVSSCENELNSKFWKTETYSDDESDN